MGKNAQLHLVLESNLLEALKREADKENISVSELCRQKLNKNSQLTRIELMIEQLRYIIDKKDNF